MRAGTAAPRFDPRLACVALPTADRARLSRQCAAILARLEAGPATNADLAALSLKYTSRISDLRRAGFDIDCYNRDRATGVAWYRLMGNAPKGRLF